MVNAINNQKQWCIYALCFKNGKKYIGQTCQNVNDRWGSNGTHYLEKNKNGEYKQPKIAHAINKYGWESIEKRILFDGLDKETADRIEQICIYLLRAKSDLGGYNITAGGCGSVGTHHTVETKKKISEAKKGKYTGENHPNYGKTLSDETKQKISVARMGKYIGKENPFYGKQHTNETKEHLREINTGKHHTEEARKKISEIQKGKTNPSTVSVYCIETETIYLTITEANKITGARRHTISDCCKGTAYTANGMHWRYATNEEIIAEKIRRGIILSPKT